MSIAIGAIEFHWARRPLRFAQTRAAGWPCRYATRPRPLKIVAGGVVTVTVAAIALFSLWFSVGSVT